MARDAERLLASDERQDASRECEQKTPNNRHSQQQRRGSDSQQSATSSSSTARQPSAERTSPPQAKQEELAADEEPKTTSGDTATSRSKSQEQNSHQHEHNNQAQRAPEGGKRQQHRKHHQHSQHQHSQLYSHAYAPASGQHQLAAEQQQQQQPVAVSADYLAQLIKDKKQLNSMPAVFIHLPRLIDDEINKVRQSLFQLTDVGRLNEPLELPEPDGSEYVQLQEKLYVPVEEHPEYNFVGRLLGPRGMTAKQLEQETGCKIMIRGRGSMRDKKKVSPV